MSNDDRTSNEAGVSTETAVSTEAGAGTATRTRDLRPQWLNVTGWTAGGQSVMALLVLLGAAVLLGVGLAVTAQFWTPQVSYARYGTQVMLWIAFAVAVSMVYTQLGVFLAHGATRRSVVRGQILAAPAAALAWGAADTLLLRAEATVYRLAGWAHHREPVADGVVQAGQWAEGWWRYLLIHSLTMLAAVLGGAVTGAAFYRFSGGRVVVAILLLPLTVALPVLGTTNLLGDHRFSFFDGSPVMPLGLGVLAVLALAAALGVVLWTLVRDVPVRSRPA